MPRTRSLAWSQLKIGILSLGDLARQRDPFSALGAISGASPNN